MASDKPRNQIRKEWSELVNLGADELEQWLKTDESRSVGDKDSGESTGHRSGRQIVTILNTPEDDITPAQWEHRAEVVGYIKRHCAQGGPDSDVEHSAWRYSLMNWGHDPLKDKD